MPRLAVIIPLVLSACASEPQWQPPPTLAEASPASIHEVQRSLQSRHFYLVGPATGVADANLQAALWHFQQDQNLPTTGQLDRRTLAALGLPSTGAPEVLPWAPPPRPKAGGGVFHTPLAWQ